MKAVIAIQWHQYIVQEWDQLVVDQIDQKKGEKITFDTVLLTFDDEGKKVAVWAPYVAKASVTAKIIEHKRGDKVRVFKFQGKKRYHKTRGFKAHQTVLSIDTIKS